LFIIHKPLSDQSLTPIQGYRSAVSALLQTARASCHLLPSESQLALVCFQNNCTTPSHQCQFLISSSDKKYNILKCFEELIRGFNVIEMLWLESLVNKIESLRHILLYV
jgi:hypothetical protein